VHVLRDLERNPEDRVGVREVIPIARPVTIGYNQRVVINRGVRWCSLLAATVILVLAASAAADEPLGITSDRTFFIGEWTSSGRLAIQVFKTDGIYQEISRNSISGEQHISEGAWEYGPCWRRSDKNIAGNLMIYGSVSHCCYDARLVGSRLVLSYVAGSPISCNDQTLLPHKR
jgi:hypothetical protein